MTTLSDGPDESPTGGVSVDLPMRLARLWHVDEPPRRGPRPSLSRAEVVQAALDVADAEGLAAVSMGRVAAHLDRSTMALYRYVESKDELLDLMADAVAGPPPETFVEPGDEGWRPGLERWIDAQLAIFMARPWAFGLPLSNTPVGPNRLAWIDRAVAVFEHEPLTFQDKVAVAGWGALFILAEARLEREVQEAAQAGVDAFEGFEALLVSLADPVRYPAIHATARESGFTAYDPELDEMGSGLAVLLDGIEVFIARRQAEAAGT